MKYIFKSFNFGVFDYKDAEKLLNQMALKGYEFKGTGFNWFKNFAMFEKNEKAKNYQYSIDVRCGLLENQKEKYYDFYKDLGWKNIDCHNNKLHIFVAEKNKAFPLYTDDISELENLKEGMKADAGIIKMLLITVFMAFVTGLLIHKGGIGFNRLVSYGLIIYFGLFVVYGVLEIISDIIYSIKCKRCLEDGKPVPENKTLRELRFWNNIYSNISYILFPTIAIIGYSYEIWGTGLHPLDGYSTSWEIALLSMCLISIPLMLFASYKYFLQPKKRNYKVVSYIAYFMYFISSIEYFTTYFTI